MWYVIKYLRHGNEVWETVWPAAIPPSCQFVQFSLSLHAADTAIISDQDGEQLVMETRKKFDA